MVLDPVSDVTLITNALAEHFYLCSLVEQYHSPEFFGTDVYAPTITSDEDARAIALLESSAVFIGCGWQVELPLWPQSFVFSNNRKQAVSRTRYYEMERRLSLQENKHYANKCNMIIK